MHRTPLIVSFICLVSIIGIVIYTGLALPEADKYPLHWGPDGMPDRFGTRRDVYISLGLFPVMPLFMTGLFWFMPRIEPLRENLLASLRAYNLVWVFAMVFSVGVTGLISA
mgnify:CR=1 FL=1